MRLATSLVTVTLLLATAACTNLEGTGDKGYVTADGLVAEIAVDDREG